MFYFKDDNQLTVYFADGRSAIWTKDHPQFNSAVKAAKEANWVAIDYMNNQAKMLLTEKVNVLEDGTVTVTTANSTFTADENDKIIAFIKLLKEKGTIDSEIERIKPFIRNMFENPFINAVEELYDFCKAMDFEITDDGCFLAYKRVNSDLSSIHDRGKTKHAIGQYTEVDAYDTDRYQTCSKGLHFCSKGYLPSYTGDVVIIVKVNPKDVVAIPVDYDNMKGRCRRYMTVGILEDGKDLETTDIENMTNGEITVVRTEEAQQKAEEKIDKIDRITETASLMVQLNGDVEQVATTMHISVETVKRNMCRHRARSN